MVFSESFRMVCERKSDPVLVVAEGQGQGRPCSFSKMIRETRETNVLLQEEFWSHTWKETSPKNVELPKI